METDKKKEPNRKWLPAIPSTLLSDRKQANPALMGRISRQRLIVGLSTLLDAIAVGLFFVQTAVGDKDWIKEEFTSYEFYSSVSDLGVRI